MTANGIAQIVFYLVVLTALTPPLGAYMARVLRGPAHPRPVDGARAGRARHLPRSCASTRKGAGLEGLRRRGARLQRRELRPALRRSCACRATCRSTRPTCPGMTWCVAFNTAASFVTNTNWQYYGGESTLSYLSQMLGLTVQNFVSAAVGMAVLAAVIRGFARRGTGALGNFWADLVRITLYVLLPLAIVLGLVLGLPGRHADLRRPGHLPDPRGAHARRHRRRGPARHPDDLPRARWPRRSPSSSSAPTAAATTTPTRRVPFENPTPLTNFLEMLAILLIPAALTYTFGVMVGSRGARAGRSSPTMMLDAGGRDRRDRCRFEQRGSQVLQQTGVELSAPATPPAAT